MQDGEGGCHSAITIRLTVALKEHDRDVLFLLGEVKEEGDEVEESAGGL